MSLQASELALVTDELAQGLRGAQVQKAFAPTEARCYLQVHYRGETHLLCLSAERQVSRISIARSRLPAGVRNPFQRWLRDQLVGFTLVEVRVWEERVLALEFERHSAPRKLVVQFGAPSGLLLLGENDRILALSSAHPDPGWVVGKSYAPRKAAEETSPVPEASRRPSRLLPVAASRFPWAEAAEALYAARDGQIRAEQLRRKALAPLKKRYSRMARTLEKVRLEAERRPQAEKHRRMGELIARNLDRVARGMKKARLIEYGEQGPTEVEVVLQPERTPKQQVEWHFHQYRRLSRGSERAAARFRELSRESEAIRREIELMEQLPPEELVESSSQAGPPERGPKSSGRGRPYKEYVSSQGQVIWVGRDGRGNDRLTFQFAQPNDLWLHVRGGSGSHVVVPLARGAEVTSELLVDAAHLALHHSSCKGEPRGEISYTRAKYVRKQKGGAPGTVFLTGEKSFVVRIDRERLTRLLDSRRVR